MASINGISVKGMKEFLGHEGEPLSQGNLYLNNKKIGFWSQDAHGAICDNFIMENGYSESLLRDMVKKVNADKAHMAGPANNRFLLEYSLDFLMGDYITLHEDEKLYKNAVKKGYAGIVVASDGYHTVSWSLGSSYMAKNDEELLKTLDNDIKSAKQSFWAEDEYTKHTVKIYRSPRDFVIGEPIQLKDIERKPKLQDSIESCEKKSVVDNASKVESFLKRKELAEECLKKGDLDEVSVVAWEKELKTCERELEKLGYSQDKGVNDVVKKDKGNGFER